MMNAQRFWRSDKPPSFSQEKIMKDELEPRRSGIRGVIHKMMVLLLNPLVLICAGVIFFSIGFTGGLWEVGYWDPIIPGSSRSIEERARLELERLQKVGVEWDARGNDLKKRKEVLDEREAQLRKLENDLKLEKVSMEEIRKKIELMQKQFDERIVLIDANQDANIQQLAKVYSGMTAQNAAKILSTLPDPQAVLIIRKMKEAQAAKILEVWANADPLKANRITSLIRVAIPAPTETP
jgi:flagellar motility protein MotE (MotC chaperone)